MLFRSADEEVVIPSFQGQPKHSLSRRILCEPLHARMLEIIKMIVLKVRQSGLREFPAGGIVLTGGGAGMTGIRELVQKTLGGRVRIAARCIDDDMVNQLDLLRVDKVYIATLCFNITDRKTTSELQSRRNFVCRLLLEKKNHFIFFSLL